MNKITFKDLPDTTTPVNATNLNLVQDNVEDAIEDITITLDSAVSTSSTNGVENQAITNYVDGIAATIPEVKTTQTTSNTATYSCNYIDSIAGGSNVQVAQVYSADKSLTTSVADTNNVITVDAVNGTVLMYFITYAQPLANWDNGALVEIGSMFHSTNQLWLKTSSAQSYRLRISALYIPS